MRIVSVVKWCAITSMIAALMFTSAVFTVLVYGRITGTIDLGLRGPVYAEARVNSAVSAASRDAESDAVASPPANKPSAGAHPPEGKLAEEALLEAPLLNQYPELPRGCEVTSLAMLLQYKGLNVDKLELAEEMPRDDTPIDWNPDGTIRYWGNPNTGFVGDITLKSKGFGIYHLALYDLLKKHVPSAVDLTGQGFDRILRQVAKGVPVLVWTTVQFDEPTSWVEWDSPDGPVRTTYQEHAVLLVGYGKDYVVVNDPLKGATVRANRGDFEESWEALGKQALSYTKNEFK